MIGFTARASRQLRDLHQHYENLERPEAIRNLMASLAKVIDQIQTHPGRGLPAPRPYPELVRPGRAWVKAGHYWVVYRTIRPFVITGVFHDTADIPRRL